MARVSKVCNSPQCGGTKQPAQIIMDPGDEPTEVVAYTVTCQTCDTVHPPDANFIVRDAKAWEAQVKAANGGRMPIPLPAPQE